MKRYATGEIPRVGDLVRACRGRRAALGSVWGFDHAQALVLVSMGSQKVHIEPEALALVFRSPRISGRAPVDRSH